MTRTMAVLAAVALAAGPAAAVETKYALTGENTKVEFTGTKKDGKHTGGFKTVTGSATAADGAVKIDVTIECDSLYSDNDMLTNHLKGGDFFAVKDNPKATFVSTKVEKADKGHTVTGTLTLLGKAKEISFPAEIAAGDTLSIKAEFKINKNDFGMTYGKGKIDDEVTVKVAVDAKK